MACTPGTQKTALQIISGIQLAGSILAIFLGIFAVVASSSITDPKHKDLVEMANITGWIVIVVGIFGALFATFGLHSVAKENASRVKTYGIMQLVSVVLGIIFLIGSPTGSAVVGLILSGVAAYLALELSKHFENKRPININTI